MRRLSPRELKRLSKRLGIEISELENVREVRIILSDKELIFESPRVSILKMGGEKIFQVIGEPHEVVRKEEEIEISEEDIELVIAQTGVSREMAVKALKECEGDLAKAILLLSSRKGGGEA